MDGFVFGSRASIGMDIIVIATLFVLFSTGFAIYKGMKGDTVYHTKLQKFNSLILLAAVVIFEIDIRLAGWTHRAEASPYYETLVMPFLYVHLCFSIPLFFSWSATSFYAWKIVKMETIEVGQGQLALRHRRLGRVSFALLTLTALSGAVFYWVSFIAS